ncbi:MAG: hypothetical protein ISP91_01500 [Pseudomonadales bacterium]|nr:hypothetical protein [Pseudomonadales bacterium]
MYSMEFASSYTLVFTSSSYPVSEAATAGRVIDRCAIWPLIAATVPMEKIFRKSLRSTT